MKISLISVAFICALISCGDTPLSIEKPDSGLAVSVSDTVLTINNEVYNLLLILPKSSLKEESRFIYRPNFTDVELYLHPRFHVYISREDTSIDELRSEMNSDGLFDFKFYNEAEGELLYQAVLPDGTELGYNWISNIQLDNVNYIIKTDPRGEFSRENIREIQKCLTTLQLN